MPWVSLSLRAKKSNKYIQSCTLWSWRNLLIWSMLISLTLRNLKSPSKRVASIFTTLQGKTKSLLKKNNWNFILHASKRKSMNMDSGNKLWQFQFHEDRISQPKKSSTTFYFSRKWDRFTRTQRLRHKEIQTLNIHSWTGLGRFWDPLHAWSMVNDELNV